MVKVPEGSGYLPKTPDQQTKFVAIQFFQFFSLWPLTAYLYRRKKCHEIVKYWFLRVWCLPPLAQAKIFLKVIQTHFILLSKPIGMVEWISDGTITIAHILPEKNVSTRIRPWLFLKKQHHADVLG